MATIADIQKLIGADPDGRWGPRSQAALDAIIHPIPEVVKLPVGDILWPRESDAGAFYGFADGSSAWEAANLVSFPAPYALFMDGQLIRNIRCHRKVQASLSRILLAIIQLYPTSGDRAAAGIDQYDGCYNFRNVRGGGHLSMHSYGAAIDFDAAHNPLGATHGRMPPEVVAIFKEEGWRWGGDYQGRKDWMHFEACR